VGVLVDGCAMEESYASVAVVVVDAVGPPTESELEIDRPMAEALLDIVQGVGSVASSEGKGYEENSLLTAIDGIMPWSSTIQDIATTKGYQQFGGVVEERSPSPSPSNTSNTSDNSSDSSSSIPPSSSLSSVRTLHPQWIVSLLRTKALSALWCGMRNEQGSIMSVVGSERSTTLLHNVAEHQVTLSSMNTTNNIHNSETKQKENGSISASDDILTTTAGDLSRLEIMSITEQSMQLDRLFKDQEDDETHQQEDAVTSLTRLLSFPSSFDPQRSFG
jgi:hypothetical protein